MEHLSVPVKYLGAPLNIGQSLLKIQGFRGTLDGLYRIFRGSMEHLRVPVEYLGVPCNI